MLEKLRSKWFIPVWTILRIGLGVRWLMAGWHKILNGFNASSFLEEAIGNTVGSNPVVQNWYAFFLKKFALPNVELFNFIIPGSEFVIGLCLIFGTFTTIALYIGAFMNLNFLLAGAAHSTPLFFTTAIILLAMGTQAYIWGGDRYLLPRLKNYFNDIFNREECIVK